MLIPLLSIVYEHCLLVIGAVFHGLRACTLPLSKLQIPVYVQEPRLSQVGQKKIFITVR